jgi:cell wall-associated NlpC family hydrolase
MILTQDREICEALLEGARERGDHALPLPRLVAAAGRLFLGAPYEAGTLEGGEPEELVVNLRSFDCVTFVETAIALALTIRAQKTGFADFAAALERLRYRGGKRGGYASRLHYFTDWLRDNGRRGIVRDITAGLGGIPFRKDFHALTDRRKELPLLGDEAVFRRMRLMEGACSRRTLHRIPKADLKRVETGILEGDIVAIAADAPGIDVSHAGIAVRGPGALRLLHASGEAGRVAVSEGTLSRYLAARPSRTGVVVGRVLDPTELRTVPPAKAPT